MKVIINPMVIRWSINKFITGTVLIVLLMAQNGFCLYNNYSERSVPNTGRNIITFTGNDLQGVVNEANPHDIIMADPNKTLMVEETIIIDKPLTISGLRAQLPDDLGGVGILHVIGDGFRMDNFHLIGNRHSDFSDRATLLTLEGNDFVVEQGKIEQASRHGIMVRATEERSPENGVVRDIIGYDIARDHVSIEGHGDGQIVKNVVVERIRAYGSENRGAVEVADGSKNVTVRDIYAEDARYGVDFQDHQGRETYQPNINTIIENVFVRRCSHAVRASTSISVGKGGTEPPSTGFGHRNLTIRNISGVEWIGTSDSGLDGRRQKMAMPVVVNHTDNVLIENVDIMGVGEHIYAAFLILNSSNVRVHNVNIDSVSVYREALLVENSTDVQINSVFVNASERVETENVVLRYRLNDNGVYSNFRVNDFYATGSADRIVLEAMEPTGDFREYHRRRFTGEGMEFAPTSADVTLENYTINYEPSLVEDHIGVQNVTK